VTDGFVDSGFKGYADDVAEACAKFQLGDLIADPPFVIGRDGNEDVAIGSPGRPPGAGALVAGTGPPYAIIISQTCDIRDRDRMQPWIAAYPVYRYPDKKSAPRRAYYYPLEGVQALGDGFWVVDFRMPKSLEKTVLVGRDPIRVFADEDAERDFAEAVGRRFDRAALADVINGVLYKEMSRKFRNNRDKAKIVFGKLHLIGLAIEQGTMLDPRAVQLHFITKKGETLEKDELEWLERYYDEARRLAEAHDPSLVLLGNVFHDGGKMDVTLLDDLLPLHWSP